MFDTKIHVTNEANNDRNIYFDLTETTLKECYNNHKQDVKHIKYQYNTELTKFIRNLKNNNIKSNIEWKVVDKVYGNASLAMCKLFDEKAQLLITMMNILNKNLELINECRHLNKFLLKNVKKRQRTLVLCVFVYLYYT